MSCIVAGPSAAPAWAPEARQYGGVVTEALGSRAGTVADLVHVAVDGIHQASPNDDEKVLCSGGVHRVFPSDSWEIEERCQLCAAESWKKTTPLGKRAAKRRKSSSCVHGHSLTAPGSRLTDGRCRACSAAASKARRRAVRERGPRLERIPFERAFTSREGKLVPLAPEGRLAFEGEVEEVTEESLLVRVVSEVATDGRARTMAWTAVLQKGEAVGGAGLGDRVVVTAHLVRSPADVSRAYGTVENLEVIADHAEEDALFGEGLSDQFWAKVRREEGRSGCWIWEGHADKKTGRGRGVANGQRRPAHLHVWEQLHEPLPAGHALEADCGNPFCIRPSHQRAVLVAVVAGTAAKNAARQECQKCGSELEITKSGRRCVPCTRARARTNTAAYRARRQEVAA